MKIDKCFWIKTKENKFYYVFNPYLKNAQYCIETINIINETNFNLEDVKYWFEGIENPFK